ncbi:MAG: hypothetical protein P8188_03605 [Gemmatimonadota bacterium]
MAESEPTPEVRGALEAWRASWDDPVADGSSRADARRTVAAHLASVMDAREVEEAFRSLLWAETEVERLGPLPPELALPLAEARSLTAEAGAARREGRVLAAIEAGLAAADLYRSLTPEAIGRRLVARGRALLAGMEDPAEDLGGQGGAVDVVGRARHLLDGAARALANGDAPVAVQRAFYGIQVLEGRMEVPDPEASSGTVDPGESPQGPAAY